MLAEATSRPVRTEKTPFSLLAIAPLSLINFVSDRYRPETYPFVTGENGYGVPFSQLIFRAKFGEPEGFFIGGSGRKLRYEIHKQSVRIFDHYQNSYSMRADIDSSRTVNFAIYTRKLADLSVVHPDMFARKFISFSLNYFERNGFQVRRCKGDWYEESVRHKAYKDARAGGATAKEAALIAGENFVRCGFSQVESVHEKERLVIAHFIRPNNLRG